MNTTVFSENIKKYRIAKHMTQEDVAELLHISPQSVSRWECSATMPDIMTLPVLAELYGVTVDDFFKKHSVAYDNYAQRLSSVYEKSRDPEDFLRCALEYKKLMKGGELSTVDKWNYATIHHFMMNYCKDTALEWYDKAINDGYDSNPDIYSRSCSLKAQLLKELGRIDEVIAYQNKKCDSSPDNDIEFVTLIEAYILAKKYEEAHRICLDAIKRFPKSWRLYMSCGEIYEQMKDYDKAFACWEKAGEIGTYFYDEYYAKAACYNKMGEYQKAYDMYMEIAQKLRGNNFDIEADMAESTAKEIKAKMN